MPLHRLFRSLLLQAFKQLLICFLSLWFEFPTILYKQNHSVCTLFVWFLSLHIMRVTHVFKQINSSLLFFLLLSSIPLHEHTTIYLSIDGHLSCLVVSSIWLLQVKLLWTFIYTGLFMWTYVFIHLRYLHWVFTPNSRMPGP